MSSDAKSSLADFGRRLLAWHRRYGRHDLPWQRDPTPYRVWVSEIMLQQTQVTTVLRYFDPFMARFPDVPGLAAATLDEVLHLWSGLGYYARARNLHRAAQCIRDEHGGELPGELASLQALPGIGRSTASAILALSRGQRHPILDGNVKRVLARYHAVAGWPGTPSVTRQLWDLAERHTPRQPAQVPRYTQAIMDLGASVCARRQPRCHRCPLVTGCQAHAQGAESTYPAPRPRKALPVRAVTFVLVRRADRSVLLEKRPPAGVWGGLWGFPEVEPRADLEQWCRGRFGTRPATVAPMDGLRHTFTHFHLDIVPVLLEVGAVPSGAIRSGDTVWCDPSSPPAVGLAAPVSTLLARVAQR